MRHQLKQIVYPIRGHYTSGHRSRDREEATDSAYRWRPAAPVIA
ncbi:MAG: hypothetical protein ACRD18_10265 [Terriglobia bacterium]